MNESIDSLSMRRTPRCAPLVTLRISNGFFRQKAIRKSFDLERPEYFTAPGTRSHRGANVTGPP